MWKSSFPEWWITLLHERRMWRVLDVIEQLIGDNVRIAEALATPGEPPPSRRSAESRFRSKDRAPELTNEAIRELYKSEVSLVWRRLEMLGVPVRDVEDAVHEVFSRVVQNRAMYDSARGPLRGWLLGITINVAHEVRRRAAYRPLCPEGERDEERAPRMGAIEPLYPDDRPEQAGVRRALASLCDADIEILVLHEILEMHIKEIAPQIGVTVEALESRHRRALKRFAEKLQLQRDERRERDE